MKVTQFVKETFIKNYASGGKGVLDIYGVPRVFINDIKFENNGDSIWNVLNHYGAVPTLVKGLSGNEMTINNAINGIAVPPTPATDFLTSKMCQAMIRIEKSLQLK